jgi:predicted transcriptional regulator
MNDSDNMVGKKQNFKVGKIENLTEAQKKIIKHLLKVSHHGQAVWLIKKNLSISMDTVSRAKRELADRGIFLRKRGYATINPAVLVKLQEE